MRRVSTNALPAPGKLRTAGPLKVKASGGVGTMDDLREMVEAGAERVGASRTAAIVGNAAGTAPSAY
jgi:deoxyribose-phosphate aldolase